LIAAKNLIKNISSRRDTIEKVVSAIMEHQIAFLQKGPGHLKPLVHHEIAEVTGFHESTVSRVTTNKYIQTSWGVFELKYFFVSKLKSDQELGDRSVDEVMRLLEDIITHENHERPYSDEEIVKKMESAGINVARRTIAKYRGILNIASSTKRKRLYMIKLEEPK
jgi:RNA polymerase sigma-54 factor